MITENRIYLYVFNNTRCIVTPIAIPNRMNLTDQLEIAKQAVEQIVIHKNKMVNIFCLKGIPLPSR